MRGPRRRYVLEVALEIADDPVHLKARVLLDQRLRAVAHHALGDIERHVALERAGGLQGVEQHARLRGGARAELDELAGACQLGDLLGAPLEDRALGARLVVLGELADPVEQLGAARVVEVLRRQLLERSREAVEDVLGKRTASAPSRWDSMWIGSCVSTARGEWALHAHDVPREPDAGEDLPALGRSQLRKVGLATR